MTATTTRGPGAPTRADHWRAGAVYTLVTLVGVGAFAWPFFLPLESAPMAAHAVDAPIIGGLVATLAVGVLAVELRTGRMNGATIALLGVLAATGGLLRLLQLPGGGSGIFLMVVLAGAAFGARFGLLLGLSTMAASAVITGGIGPWLPFQMLALAWMGAGAGLLRPAVRRLPVAGAVALLVVYGWLWGFAYGGIMNLWFWPFVVDGSPISYEPGASLAETARRYAGFYAVTSFAWDAAGAFANAVLLAITGAPVLAMLSRVAGRLDPVVEIEAQPPPVRPDTAGAPVDGPGDRPRDGTLGS